MGQLSQAHTMRVISCWLASFPSAEKKKKVKQARTCQLMRLPCGVGPSYVDVYRSTYICILR